MASSISPKEVGQVIKQEESPKKTITELAPEIHLLLFDRLDAVSSTCLGLTCKSFHTIHKQRWGVVSLTASGVRNTRIRRSGEQLHVLLESWMPKELVYWGDKREGFSKYVTRERAKELKDRFEERYYWRLSCE